VSHAAAARPAAALGRARRVLCTLDTERGWSIRMTPQRASAWSRCALLMSIATLVAIGLGIGSLPAGADEGASSNTTSPPCSAIRLTVGNPVPGDLLLPGDYVIQGLALDASAAQAPGVDRIQVFFDQSRENGGRFIGEVLEGEDAPNQRLTATGFALVASLPDTSAVNNTHLLFIYARSASNGQEHIASFQMQLRKPLSVGSALTPTPTPPPVSLSPAPCGSPTPTPTFPSFPVALAAATPGVVGDSLTLRVFNPQSGDSLAHGQYVIQGLAFDASAQGGTGIERVEVFLDPRDEGGQFLGAATVGVSGAGGPFGFELVAPLPNRRGGHSLSVYTRSSISGRETGLSIPITIT
jgi:hypothetical protein